MQQSESDRLHSILVDDKPDCPAMANNDLMTSGPRAVTCKIRNGTAYKSGRSRE